MKEECACGLNLSDLARGTPYRDLGFRKIICATCGKEFYNRYKGYRPLFRVREDDAMQKIETLPYPMSDKVKKSVEAIGEKDYKDT